MNTVYKHSQAWKVSWFFVFVAGVSLLFADIEIISLEPWQELKRLFFGLITPDWSHPKEIGEA
ncbi:MAG: ABC transporter permease, partial [Gammaproteobacteria bacterium]|nr:ABC transporter permease [Gammaproteobacteria bacterium]